MRKYGLAHLLIVFLIAVCGGCSNVCQDPHSVNFNQAGKCIDVAGNIAGTYNGILQDSTVTGNTQYTVVIKVTKTNNSDVSVQLTSPTGAPFTPFNASVVSTSAGYDLTVIADGTVTGAAANYGSQADGVYFSSNGQLSFYTMSTSGTLEAFTGLRH